MLRHSIATTLIGTSLLCLACSGAQTSTSVGQATSLEVVTPGDYAPFATCSKTSPPICNGFDVELVESFAAHRGLQISWTLSTWATLSEDLRSHDMAIGGITIREERRLVGPFSEPLVHTGKQALMRCADTNRFSTWEAIEGDARIVANLGGGNEGFARTHFDPKAVRILTANQAVPPALLNGGADVFFTDGPEAELLAREHEALCVGLDAKLHEPFDLAVWFAPSASGLRDDFTRYLRSQVGGKRLRELRSRYMLKQP
jgi:cyclohexadienyl dehydratase